MSQKNLLLFGVKVILGNAESEFKDFVEKTGIPQHGQFLVSRQFLRIINLMLEWLVCMEIMVQMF